VAIAQLDLSNRPAHGVKSGAGQSSRGSWRIAARGTGMDSRIARFGRCVGSGSKSDANIGVPELIRIVRDEKDAPNQAPTMDRPRTFCPL
jgi:hypothetical protein